MTLKHYHRIVCSWIICLCCTMAVMADSTTTTANALPQKMNIAVTTIKNAAGVTEGEIDLLADRLRAELFTTGAVNVMEREQMQAILKEQGFQQSGACSDEACLVEMGQLLGVQKIVTGSLGKLGSLFMINLRIIDVKTGQIVKVVSKDIRGNIENIVGELRPIAQELTGTSDQAPVPPVAASLQNRIIPAPRRTAPAPQPPAIQPAPAPSKPIAEKNRNRSGLKFASTIYPAQVVSIELKGAPGTLINNPVVKNYPIVMNGSTAALVLKTGPFLTIDLGAGYTRGAYRVDTLTAAAITHTYNIFSLSTALNATRRIHPFKLNAGCKLDFSSMVLGYSREKRGVSTFGITDTSYLHDPVGGALFGLSLGLEYLLGRHFGLGCDFVFSRMVFEETLSGINKISVTHTLPGRGICFSLNCYF